MSESKKVVVLSALCSIVTTVAGVAVGYLSAWQQHRSAERDRCAAIAGEGQQSLERYRRCVKESESWNRSPKK